MRAIGLFTLLVVLGSAPITLAQEAAATSQLPAALEAIGVADSAVVTNEVAHNVRGQGGGVIIPPCWLPKPRTCAPAPQTCAPRPRPCAPKPRPCAPAPQTCAPKPRPCAPSPRTCAPKAWPCAPTPHAYAPKPWTCMPGPSKFAHR